MKQQQEVKNMERQETNKRKGQNKKERVNKARAKKPLKPSKNIVFFSNITS